MMTKIKTKTAFNDSVNEQAATRPFRPRPVPSWPRQPVLPPARAIGWRKSDKRVEGQRRSISHHARAARVVVFAQVGHHAGHRGEVHVGRGDRVVEGTQHLLCHLGHQSLCDKGDAASDSACVCERERKREIEGGAGLLIYIETTSFL